MSAVARRYRWKEPGGLATALQILLVAAGILALVGSVAVAVAFSRRSLIFRVPEDGRQGTVEFPFEEMRWFGLLWIPSLLSQVTLVVWLVWQHQATGNLWARGLEGLRTTPGWAVGWWFIPFANYVMPYLAVRELDERSSADGASRRVSPLVAWWWAAWVGGQLIPLVGIFGWAFPTMLEWAETIEEGATTVDLGPFMRAFLPWAVVAGVCQSMAGIFASQVVGRIDRGQRAMAAAGPPVPPRPDVGR